MILTKGLAVLTAEFIVGVGREASERSWTPVTHLEPYCSTSKKDKDNWRKTENGSGISRRYKLSRK